MKRTLILLFALAYLGFVLSCGNSLSSQSQTTGLKYRAFISDSASVGSSAAGVYIFDAQNDVHPASSPIGAGNTPGMMVVSPSHGQTLVFSGSGTLGSDNQLTFINNTTESAVGRLTLPGMTESVVISPDGSAAFAAMPTAQVIGQSPGVLKAISMSGTSFTGEVDVPSIHYLAINNSGNRVLGFSDNSDSIAVITPSNINMGNAVSYISGFDRPVAAFFSSDDNTAWVVNCGAECGGATASVQQVDMASGALGPYVAACAPGTLQCAASVALVSGSTMYLAGTPYSGGAPSQSCAGQTTQATTCGLLTIVNLSSMTVTNTAPIVITDGYHNRIAMGANGQLFIGSRTCTEVIPPVPPPQGAETRGCLSIYNSNKGTVVIPPANGDVTGLDPIAKRTVVYVIQGGSIGIYDTATDALQVKQITNIVGQFVDAKTVDF